jgi:hypothetical protein
LKAAAEGKTNYDALIVAVADQIELYVSLLDLSIALKVPYVKLYCFLKWQPHVVTQSLVGRNRVLFACSGCPLRRAETRSNAACVRSRLLAVERYGSKPSCRKSAYLRISSVGASVPQWPLAEDCTRPTPTRQFTTCNAGAIHRGHARRTHRRPLSGGEADIVESD